MPIALILASAVILTVAACGDDDDGGSFSGTLSIGGIPDQDVSTLERQFGLMADYLADATGLDVEYVPSVDYAAIVTAFDRGDVQLAWFGGLTGVQARAVVEGSEAIVQRPRDAEFHSVFIAQCSLNATSLEDLAGLTFTFGSESSTSGHLMPRYFLSEAGIDADEDFNGEPNYSGSHDKTYELVEAGAFQSGALNEAVWRDAVETGSVDTSKVCEVLTTDSYYDYNWSIRPDVDEEFGEGTREALIDAMLELNANMGEEEAELLDLFQTDSFVPTDNANYRAIERVAVDLGIIE